MNEMKAGETFNRITTLSTAKVNDHYLETKIEQAKEKGFEFEVLDWPSQSPDLNPIEHLWAYLKRRLADRKIYPTRPTDENELWERVKVEWAAIPVETCRNLVNSMKERCNCVVKNKGYSTKY